MGWITAVKRSLAKAFIPPGASMMGLLRPFAEPPKKGTKELLEAFHTSPWAHVVADKVGDAVGATVWQMLQPAAAPKRPGKAALRKLVRSPPAARRKLVEKAVRGGEVIELDDHPALAILEHPNEEMDGSDFFRLLQIWLDFKGEGYALIERNEAGFPARLYPLPPHWIQALPSARRPVYEVRLSNQGGIWEVPETEIIPFKRADPVNPFGRGAGLAQVLDDDLDIDNFSKKHVRTWFYNRATPDAIVTVETSDDAEIKRMKAQWEAAHRGFWNAFRAFWTKAKITVERMDTSFRDMQLRELRRDVRDLVINARGIPPEIVGILANSNRATIEAAAYFFAAFIVDPAVEALRKKLQARLVAEFDDQAILDYVSPVPDDREFILKAAQSFPTLFRKDEIRAICYLPELGEDDGGEDFLPAPAAPTFAPPAAPAELPPGKGGDPAWARRARRALPPARKLLAEADVEDLLERLRPDYLTREIDPVWQARVDEWAQRILDDLGQGARFDLLNPLIAEHLRDLSSKRIGGLVNTTTRQDLRDSLVDGVRAGEDIDSLAKRVKHVMGIAQESRAELIARTEVLHSSNWATFEAQKVSGVVDRRQWVATPDGRTREDHRQLNGQERGLAQPFEVDGQTTMYPGGFGLPEQDCNCRCTTVAVIDDPKAGEVAEQKSVDLEAAWKTFDARLVPWESDATRALRRGFRAQEDAVLEALDARR